jgi:hypothetical protein
VDTSGTLSTISGSLVDTSGTLTTATGTLVTIRKSLVDTSGVLVTVSGRVKTINKVLHDAESPSSQGVGAVPPLVTSINGSAGGILGDTHKINQGLSDAEAHLTSTCKSVAIQALALTAGNLGKC